MAQQTAIQPTPLLICRLRVTRLNADGTVAAGPKNSYVTAKVGHLNFTPNIQQGQQRTLISGCDCVNASYRGPDLLLNFSLELEKQALEPALEEMLLGAPLLTDDSTEPVPIGIQFPVALTCGDAPAFTAIEAWSENWIQGGQALAPFQFTHWLWPMATWQLNNGSLQNDFLSPTLVGQTRENAAWGVGPYGDLNPGVVSGGGIGPAGGYVFTNTQPAVTNAYATASSS